MNVFELTRALVDIESITNNEERVGNYLYELPGAPGRALRRPHRAHRGRTAPLQRLRPVGRAPAGHALHPHGYRAALLPLARGRRVHLGPRRLRHQGHHRLHDQGRRRRCSNRGSAASACCSSSARSATAPAPTRPPSTRAARATSSTASPPKTAWRSAPRARCATRSAAPARWPTPPIPNWAIPPSNKLLDALEAIRRIPLPVDELLGPSTLNIGTISGGRAPNVIADEARAEIMIRLVGDSTATKAALFHAAEGRAELREVIEIPARAPRTPSTASPPPSWPSPPTFPRSAAPGASPCSSGPAPFTWRTPWKSACPNGSLLEAVELYQRIVKDLCKRESK